MALKNKNVLCRVKENCGWPRLLMLCMLCWLRVHTIAATNIDECLGFKVDLAEDVEESLIFHYRLVVKEGCREENVTVKPCDGRAVHIYKCDGKKVNYDSDIDEKSCRVVNCYGGCLKVRSTTYQPPHNYIESPKFHMPDVRNASLRLIGEPEFSANHLSLHLKPEHRVPSWVEGWIMEVYYHEGNNYMICAKANYDGKQSPLVIPANFTAGIGYDIRYRVKLRDKTCSKGPMVTLKDRVEYKEVLQAPRTQVIVVVMVVLLVAMVVVGVVVYRKWPIKPLVPNPWQVLQNSVGDVLILYDKEDSAVKPRCHKLANDISNRCNRQVHDIASLHYNSPEVRQDPSAWLLNQLMLKDTTVLLVLSKAIREDIEVLERGGHETETNIEEGAIKTLSCDPLIHNCLRTIQQNPSSFRHRFAFVRMSEEVVGGKTATLDHLTTARPFVLPREQQQLLDCLKPV